LYYITTKNAKKTNDTANLYLIVSIKLEIVACVRMAFKAQIIFGVLIIASVALQALV
jgi:hypothetical protein